MSVEPAEAEFASRRRGTVATFAASAGVGEIDSDGEHFAFHCTAIEDGTRLIPVGAAVEFDVVPGPLGRWEAAAIERDDGERR